MQRRVAIAATCDGVYTDTRRQRHHKAEKQETPARRCHRAWRKYAARRSKRRWHSERLVGGGDWSRGPHGRGGWGGKDQRRLRLEAAFLEPSGRHLAQNIDTAWECKRERHHQRWHGLRPQPRVGHKRPAKQVLPGGR